MPLNVALQQPDRDKFINAMARELEQHTELKHWKIIHKSQLPKNAKPIAMVWTLRCKRDSIAEILKWKACLCARGHCQVFGDTYWTTFAPVVSWMTVQRVLSWPCCWDGTCGPSSSSWPTHKPMSRLTSICNSPLALQSKVWNLTNIC